MNVLVLLDDTVYKSEVIYEIIGSKGFSEVVVRRQTLASLLFNAIGSCFNNAKQLTIHNHYEFNTLKNDLELLSDDTHIIHFFSNFFISDNAEAALTFRKLEYIDRNYTIISDHKVVGVFSPSVTEYEKFLNLVVHDPDNSSVNAAKEITDHMPVNGITDIGETENFIQCITGNFDSRYFNNLEGDEYIIVKSSSNKKKIKAEYTFYHLLPEDMQMWFVEPFGYSETDETASYCMERLHMTDLAIKWVHGPITEKEFSVILDKYFYFFSHRHTRNVSQEEYQKTADKLYVDKVNDRIKELKKMPEFEKMAALLKITDISDIDRLTERYFALKARLEKNIKCPCISVIGHGDPCFANTLYHKSTRALKFIDPKGALSENELWTDPYYDIAKLSHSICGYYDFFNNDLFEIIVDKQFNTKLHIDFDNTPYVKLFRQKLEEDHYDYWLVRLYEVSLFLSMLPLHIDNPHKVYGFILNADSILKEIENNV